MNHNLIIKINREDFSYWTVKRLEHAWDLGYRGIILNAMGTDLFPVEQARKIGFIVSWLPDYCSSEVSNNGFKLYRGLAKKIGRTPAPFDTNCLVIGSEGNIGSKVCNTLFKHDTKYSRYDVVLKQTLDDLKIKMALAETIFVTIPLNYSTLNFFDSKLLKQCARSPVIINVSGRQQLFNESDLYYALVHDTLGGYACDESIVHVQKRLVECQKCFFTPHIGWFSEDAKKRREYLLDSIEKNINKQLQLIGN